jgi:peptidoglycan hydrolase-like protein with peptidoglycan-binding domain
MLFLWARAARRPIDSIAIFAALAVSMVIILNALVLQSGSSPAPFVANAPAQPAGADRRTAVQRSSLHWAGPPAPQELAAAGNDPIGQLIGLSSRIMAVQRALSDYGYGQLKPTGILDQPTSIAIEKFQREHGLPINGRVSERLMNELAAMVGHPLQ